jgi:hypothetical protein
MHFCQGSRLGTGLRIGLLGLGALLLLAPYSGATEQPSGSRPRTALTVWDTGSASAEALAPAALAAREGWTPVTATTPTPIKGDAVLSNGRIEVVVRGLAGTLDVYVPEASGPVARLHLQLLAPGGQALARFEQLSLVENTKSSAAVEVTGKTAEGEAAAAKFRIKRGEVFVETEPGTGASRLRVACPGRFAILPDFFADDIVIDAARIPLASVEVPTDNFVVHPTGTGEALGVCIFESRRQDVRLDLAGEGNQRLVTASEIGFEGKRIWTAAVSASGIWHHRDVADNEEDAGSILPLEWYMPFRAQWRVDFTRKDGLTDSWEMLLQAKKNARYVKPSWLGGREETLALSRWRWNTYLDTFAYPCWSDHEGQGYLQPLKKRDFRVQGPVVLYPINRVKETPLDTYTVVDLMRSTLGVGPCEHILDVEGQRTNYTGQPTCGVRGDLEEIFKEHQQKQKRAEVEKLLGNALAFVTHIRSRISRYIEFGHAMRAYLAEQKKAHPELAEPIASLDKIVERIDRHVAPETARIKKPDFVARLNDDFRKNILPYEGPDLQDRLKKYGEVLTDIGGNQDELVGESRWVARTLRQRAGILAALDPRLAPVAAEIRTRTQEVLRNPAGYEWSRH